MHKQERNWLIVLVVVFLIFNIITLSTLVPWQEWLLWSKPTPSQQVKIEIANYTMQFPADPIQVKKGEYVEFIATSQDVTYGFGVFRQDGTMVFQMQVLPGHENKLLWKFDAAGNYTVRSTEYSGPRHSEMVYPDKILVTQ